MNDPKKMAKKLLEHFDPPLIKKVEPRRYVVLSKRVSSSTAIECARGLRDLLKYVAKGDTVKTEKRSKKHNRRPKKEK